MRADVTVGLGFGLLVSLAVPACGGGGSAPAKLESASLCESGWQPLTPGAPFDITSSLAYQDGVIYYTTPLTNALMAQPATGAFPTQIATGPFGYELWVDGDQFIIPGGDHGTQFFSVPVAGGSPTLIFDGAAGRTDPGFETAYAITPTDLFWLEEGPAVPGGPTTAWRGSRAGGVATAIGGATATYPGGDVLPFQHMAVAADAVLMGEDLGVAAAVPLDGSTARALATSDDLMRARGGYAGIDAAGVYWTVPRAGAREEDDAWSVALAPADGGPLRLFWDGLPAHSAVWNMWPDGDGGWVAVAGQLFDDLKSRIAIWLIDASGNGRRLGCSPPGDGTSTPNVDVRPAIAPDAIYVEDSGEKLQIVRVPR